MDSQEKKQIEKDIREMAGIIDEETPVILDLESVRVTAPGKYEIDLVNLFTSFSKRLCGFKCLNLLVKHSYRFI